MKNTLTTIKSIIKNKSVTGDSDETIVRKLNNVVKNYNPKGNIWDQEKYDSILKKSFKTKNNNRKLFIFYAKKIKNKIENYQNKKIPLDPVIEPEELIVKLPTMEIPEIMVADKPMEIIEVMEPLPLFKDSMLDICTKDQIVSKELKNIEKCLRSNVKSRDTYFSETINKCLNILRHQLCNLINRMPPLKLNKTHTMAFMGCLEDEDLFFAFLDGMVQMHEMKKLDFYESTRKTKGLFGKRRSQRRRKRKYRNSKKSRKSRRLRRRSKKKSKR